MPPIAERNSRCWLEYARSEPTALRLGHDPEGCWIVSLSCLLDAVVPARRAVDRDHASNNVTPLAFWIGPVVMILQMLLELDVDGGPLLSSKDCLRATPFVGRQDADGLIRHWQALSRIGQDWLAS